MHQALDAEHGVLIHVEVGVHRVLRNDSGQERLILLDQISDRQKVVAGDPVDRRGDLGELHVELGRIRIGFGGGDGRHGFVFRSRVFIDVLPADGPRGFGDFQRPFVIGDCQLQPRLRKTNLAVDRRRVSDKPDAAPPQTIVDWFRHGVLRNCKRRIPARAANRKLPTASDQSRDSEFCWDAFISATPSGVPTTTMPSPA